MQLFCSRYFKPEALSVINRNFNRGTIIPRFFRRNDNVDPPELFYDYLIYFIISNINKKKKIAIR